LWRIVGAFMLALPKIAKCPGNALDARSALTAIGLRCSVREHSKQPVRAPSIGRHLMGFLYIDGHVRAYHGERAICADPDSHPQEYPGWQNSPPHARPTRSSADAPPRAKFWLGLG